MGMFDFDTKASKRQEEYREKLRIHEALSRTSPAYQAKQVEGLTASNDRSVENISRTVENVSRMEQSTTTPLAVKFMTISLGAMEAILTKGVTPTTTTTTTTATP